MRSRVRLPIQGRAAGAVELPYFFLRGRRMPEAAAQEANALMMTGWTHGAESEEAVWAMRQFATQRGWVSDYEGAADWATQAVVKMKSLPTVDPSFREDVLAAQVRGLSNAGRFEDARQVLQEIDVAAMTETRKQLMEPSVRRYLGAIEFGLRRYAEAETLLRNNVELWKANGFTAAAGADAISWVACRVALGQDATEALARASELEAEVASKRRSGSTDSWRLALAHAAVGRWEEALRYAPMQQRKSGVGYTEFARMMTLLAKGDRREAIELAKQLQKRFTSLDELNLQDDLDAMYVALMRALAEGTGAAIQAAQTQWQTAVPNLKNRPLENYLAAKVIVVCLAKLNGR